MKQKILIIDDSATARLLFKSCFVDYPEYEIIEVSHWQEGVEKALSNDFFMIVLDYNMPEKTGNEVAKLLQKKGINAHYVLITANTQKAIVDEVKQLGFAGVIEKPISVEEIQSLLEKLS